MSEVYAYKVRAKFGVVAVRATSATSFFCAIVTGTNCAAVCCGAGAASAALDFSRCNTRERQIADLVGIAFHTRKTIKKKATRASRSIEEPAFCAAQKLTQLFAKLRSLSHLE
ncbi:hypothetical protein JIR23_08760 [Bradyrhizobium diazoefficiens]|nr:hypothetical protein [Bradyrhizobium diazoefficiens]QQN65759.1 hypothetical protein JIR23_08760 [Bradyrhizobium diazoefficiens]